MIPVVLQSGGPGLGVSVAFVAVGLGVLALFARRSVGRLFTILQTEPRSVAGIRPGPVEFEGTVVPAEEAEGNVMPTGGTFDARSYELDTDEAVVTQYRRSGSDPDSDDDPDFTLPVPQQFAPDILNDETVIPFYVEDDTGRVLVDPAYADISLKSDHSEVDHTTEYRQVEGVLEAGESVWVLGQAVPAEEYPERATHRGGLLRSLVRFFRGGGLNTAEEVVDGEDMVVTRSSGSAEFVISDVSGTRNLLRQGLMAAFWTLSGLIAVGGGVYLLVDSLVGI
jgi:hypothetical protein